uniref:Kyphoscoliosis peptidase n=1 Tax=Fundulus heteroclitus TaxID=8078 RepID=A0A3Q2QEY6_FUNHE
MSAEVALQKFSFPFACSVSLSSQDKVTQKGPALVKDPELHTPKDNPILGEPTRITVVQAFVNNEDQALESTKPPDGGDTAAVQLSVSAEASQNAVVARQSMAENLRVEGEDQRPAAKRQLSSESAAKSITAVKKSAQRKEPNEQTHLHQKAQLGQRGGLNAALPGQRKRSRDLFKSSEVFHRLDSDVIRAGAELKQKCVCDVKTIVKSITQGARNELEQLRAIWVWLCNNIEYDVSGYLGHTEKLSSPEEVIAAGRGVCCSYSNLCTKMCRFDDFYFLTDPEEFIDSHFPDEQKWQLLDKPISIEEFEKRVFKTSAFFTMGLRLISPLHYHIITDDGEATVSLGFSRPTTFTYEITQHQDLLHCGALEQKESSSSSFGLLTVSHRSMKLQLMPPQSDTYDVQLFARSEKAMTPLIWVCSFTVECPNPKATEDIPENPFLSWGLQPFAGSLGVIGSSQNSEVTEVEDGVFDMVLKTCKPLMVLCELVHPQMDDAISKCCLATQIQPDSLTCHVLCPFHGFYRLSLFVRDYEKTEVKFENAANYLLHCKGKVVGLEELFPPNLGSACGPGTRTARAGLSRFSHNLALVSTQQGKCNITFHNQQDLELHYVLSKKNIPSTFPLSRYIFCTYTDHKVTVSLSLPEAGMYRLGLYARITSGGDFSPMCDFVLKNSFPQIRPPFPCVYSAWGKGCVLFEPRVGLLEPLSWVLFRVRVPGALRIKFCCHDIKQLTSVTTVPPHELQHVFATGLRLAAH